MEHAIFLNLLLPAHALGFFGISFLLLFCFVGVHILRLIELGLKEARKTQTKPQSPPPPEAQKTSPPKKEPVYYFVERKPPAPMQLYKKDK